MQNLVALLLKQQTAGTHDRVEAALGLLNDELSVERLRSVLSRFAGFWRLSEQAIDAWAVHHRSAATALDWPRRRRGPLLRDDLLGLGLSARDLADLPVAPAVFTEPDDADVLGWLYVAEGSTLGGAIIDRTLRRSASSALRLRTFTPYPEGPGQMWRSYLDYLAGWVGDDPIRRDRVLAAAQASFSALERWLAAGVSEA